MSFSALFFVMNFRLNRFLVALSLCSTLATAAESRYAVITWKSTQQDAEWKQVTRALVDKHRALLIVCQDSIEEAKPALAKLMPQYVAVVGKPEQVPGRMINDFHQLMRQIDADPYTDARWGVITGRSADAAMKLVAEKDPLVIQRTVSGTRIASQMAQEVESFDELKARGHALKSAGGKEEELPLDDADSIAELATAFADPKTQLIITSGHATTRDWQPGYSYKNGSFHCRDGVIYGLDLNKQKHLVESDTPKVYLPCGNCLMGLVDGPDAMALAWMQGAGVRQMAGYVEPTWYGYMGWGMMDYFVEQPGRYTFAEAFLANQLALVHRLETVKDLSAANRKGLEFDRDMVAFYGDPAWSTKMAEMPMPYSQKITQSDGEISLDIHPLSGAGSYEAINTNGSQRGGRPFVAFLSERIDPTKWELVEGNDGGVVLADDFVLLPRPATGSKARSFHVVWKRKHE